MKFTSFIAPALYVACATAQIDRGCDESFTVIALRSGSPIHLQPVNAAGESFWVGGETASYCPTEISNCPPGTETVFLNGYNLDVEVPGGQNIYVNPSGALSFTQAHSIFMPTGSEEGPFIYEPGSSFGTYSTTSFGATGFMACPNNSTGSVMWQVFAAIQNATVPSGDVEDCLGFDAAATEYDGPVAAWQYI